MASKDNYGPSPAQIIFVGLAFLFTAWLSSGCFGQVYTPEAMQQVVDWNEAKKLSVLPVTVSPPFQQGPDPLTVEKEQLVDFIYWNFKVLDIIDAKNCLLQLGRETTIWLEEFPTDGLVDDQKVRLVGQLRCTGTKSYPTAIGGKRSVKSFAFISREEMRKEEERLKELEKAREEALWRTFKSKVGTEVEAKLVSYQFNVGVVLVKRDGTKITVPLAKFTDEDQQWIRSEAKAMRDAKRK